jgi:hypothetical protein
MTNLGELR